MNSRAWTLTIISCQVSVGQLAITTCRRKDFRIGLSGKSCNAQEIDKNRPTKAMACVLALLIRPVVELWSVPSFMPRQPRFYFPGTSWHVRAFCHTLAYALSAFLCYIKFSIAKLRLWKDSKVHEHLDCGRVLTYKPAPERPAYFRLGLVQGRSTCHDFRGWKGLDKDVSIFFTQKCVASGDDPPM